MPNTPLNTTARRRTSRACGPCQRAKRRCSNDRPCSYCVKRNRMSSCIYVDDTQKSSAPQAPITQPRPASIVSSRSSMRGSGGPVGSMAQLSSREHAGSDGSQTLMRINCPGDSPETTILTEPLLMRTSRGNDVYIGNTAVIGFLPLLRDIFRREMGSSNFTDPATTSTMLETELQLKDTSDLRNQTDLSQKKELVRLFFTATSGILDLFDPSHIIQNLQAFEAGQRLESSQYILFDLLLAIGARCHPDSQTYTPCELFHLNRSWQTTDIDLLENLSLDSVQICLMTAFYMLCACRRNTAYMYLGVAARAAHAIGLHHEEPIRSLEKKEISKSLHVLDSHVSCFLGRPPATQRQRHGLVPYIKNPEDADVFISSGLDATYRFLRMIDEEITDLERQQLTYTASANILLERLAKWSTSNLPSLQSVSSQLTPRLLDQDAILGNLHAACSYYFAVMQITRPFIIRHLLFNTSKELKGLGSGDLSRGLEIAQLAKACEDAAVFMLEGCQELLQEGLIIDNMCLLQAWTFAAALILGLVMFMTEEANIQIRKSFDGAMAILRKLSIRSQQSERYVEILSDLINEVDKHQQQIAALKRERSSRLVSRVFRLDCPNDNLFNDSAQSSSEVESESVNESETLGSWPPDVTGAAYLGWEDSGVLSWDDLGWVGELNNPINT